MLGHISDRRDQDGLPRDEKSRKLTANARRQPTEGSAFPEHTVSVGGTNPNPWGAGWPQGGGGAAEAAAWAPGGLRVGMGRAPAAEGRGGRVATDGSRRPRWPEAPGPETPAGPRSHSAALTHSRDRPGARALSDPASDRAARPQSPRGAGPGRAGPGGGVARGPRGRRAGGGGRGPVTCGRRRRAFPPCPAGWSSSRPRSRSPSRASGRRTAARFRPSSRRAEPRAGPPRGEGARRHGCGTWEPAPRLPPYGKMAAPGRPPPGRQARPSARPGYPAPGGAQPTARGVWGGRGRPGPAAPCGDMARGGHPYGKMAAPAGLRARRAHAPAPVPCCPLAPALAAPAARWWDPRKHDAGRRGAERAGPGLRAGSAVRQDGGGALPPRTSGPARARARSVRIGHGGGPSRRSAEPSERRRAQSAALEGRWTQVRAGGAWGGPGRRSPGRLAPGPGPGLRLRGLGAGRSGALGRSGARAASAGGRRGSDSPVCVSRAFLGRPQRPGRRSPGSAAGSDDRGSATSGTAGRDAKRCWGPGGAGP